MKRWTIGIVVSGVALATSAFAQSPGGVPGGPRGQSGPGIMGRFSPEDWDALTDARMAAVHAGLKLSPDQEKLWPPVEDALRALARQRREQRQMSRDSQGQAWDDLPGRLRAMADHQTARADALRKLADAAGPLYGTLNEGQKRRLVVLTRIMRPHRDRMAARMDQPPRDRTQP